MEIGSEGVRRHNGLGFGEVPALVDDGYWEALLDQGEVVTAETPPPWIDIERRSEINHFRGNGHEDWDEEHEWERALEMLDQEESCCLAVTGHNRGR